jgi:hypothetical protein
MTMSWLLHVFLELIGVSSSGRLHPQNPMDNMPKIARLNGTQSRATMFFWPFGFRAGDAKLCGGNDLGLRKAT